MAGRGLFAKVLMLAALEIGAMMGIPFRPEEIEALMRSMAGTTVEQHEEEERGDPPLG